MSLTEFIDSNMEETTDIVDELLISSVTEDTLGQLPVAQTVAKVQRKRKNEDAPTKKSRAKATVEAKTKAAKTGTKRKAAVEVHQDEDQDEVDMIETEPPKPKSKSKKVTASRKADLEDSELVETETAKPKARKPATTTRETVGKATKSRTKKVIPATGDFDEEEPIPSPVNIRSNFTQTKTARTLPKPVFEKSKAPAKRPMKTVSRPVEEVATEAEESGVEDLVEQPRKRQRTASVSRQEPVFRRRAGSVSDTERGDPMLRRKLGDITCKFENVDMKYKNLKEIGISDANANVEKLRKQCEAITERSDKLVASLRKELAHQAQLVEQSRKSKKETQSQEAEVTRLRSTNEGLAATLTAAQDKVKSLEAKLAAAKAAPPPEPVKLPPPPPPSKIAVPLRNGNGAQNQIQTQNDKESHMKLALYADLTDLLIQNVKQTEDGDTYDCIQTGRNGCKCRIFVPFSNA